MEIEGQVYDVIVVGAGIIGSATAYHLAKMRKRTILLEQFTLSHDKGSSHGQTRSTEMVFGTKYYYVPLSIDSAKMTEELQKECGEKLFINCGWLTFGPDDDPFIKGTEEGLKRYNCEYETFGRDEQRRRYPNMSLPDNYTFILDKSGGVLRADKMLQAFQYGGEIRHNEGMVNFTPGNIVQVETPGHVYRAKSVVFALGSWAPKFLPKLGLNLPLKPVEITVTYWKDKSFKDFSIANFPACFTFFAAGGNQLGMSPAYEYPGCVKMVLQVDGEEVDPDNRNESDNTHVLDTLKHIIAENFPTLEKTPSFVKPCLYTNTPDRDYILDVHPEWNNIVIGAGFSGHAFKLSPVIGKILAQLSTGKQPSYDISQFRISRFSKL